MDGFFPAVYIRISAEGEAMGWWVVGGVGEKIATAGLKYQGGYRYLERVSPSRKDDAAHEQVGRLERGSPNLFWELEGGCHLMPNHAVDGVISISISPGYGFCYEICSLKIMLDKYKNILFSTSSAPAFSSTPPEPPGTPPDRGSPPPSPRPPPRPL